MPSLSLGIYRLRAGEPDEQKPHAEDEIYYVLRGRACVRVGSEDRPVRRGTVLYVAANIDHCFHAIEEDLTLLVFFAPAKEYMQEVKEEVRNIRNELKEKVGREEFVALENRVTRVEKHLRAA